MSWHWAKLGELCRIEKGNIGITKAIPGKYPLVVLGEDRKNHNEYQFDDEAVIIPLVSSSGHGDRSMKRIHFQSGKFSIGSILCAVIPKDKTKLSAEFLYRYLDLNKENELVSRMKGMANVSLSVKSISEVEIPLPPYQLQNLIISRINRVESVNNSLSFEFNQQLDFIKKLRQQILQDAVQGKLVPQDNDDLPANPKNKFFAYVLECSDGSWYKGYTSDILKRWEEHLSGSGAEHTKKYPPRRIIHWEEFDTEQEAVKRDKFFKSGEGRTWLKQSEKLGRLRQAGEPASKLLERIKAEKEKLVKEGKIKKGPPSLRYGRTRKPLLEIKPEEIPFEIPENWVWCKMWQIINDTEGGKSPNCKNEPVTGDHWGVIKTTAVQDMKFIEDENKVLPHGFKVNLQHTISEGDLLITRAGPRNRVGIVCVVKQLTKNLILSDKTIRIKYMHNFIFPEYLAFALNSPLIKPLIEIKMTGMADSQVNISQENMKKLSIPLPPLNEQHRIVVKIEQLMKICDELEQSIRQNQEYTRELLQVALKEALEPKV